MEWTLPEWWTQGALPILLVAYYWLVGRKQERAATSLEILNVAEGIMAGLVKMRPSLTVGQMLLQLVEDLKKRYHMGQARAERVAAQTAAKWGIAIQDPVLLEELRVSDLVLPGQQRKPATRQPVE